MSQPETPAPVTSSPMAVCAGEPIWTDLSTPTPQQTRDFYAALFGWEYQISEEFGGYANAHLNGKVAAGISPLSQGMDGPNAWRVYFASDDLHADAGRVKSSGGSVIEGPMQVGEQGHMGFFSDPTGATFGLWQPIQHMGGQGQGVGSMVWAEVNTHDSARAVAFYSQLFRADSEQLAGVDYHTLQHGGRSFAGVSGAAQNWEAVGAGGWMVYFYTDDVDQAAQMAEQNGGKVLVAPFDMEYGRMAVLADPAGAVFTAMNPQPLGG